MPLDLRGTEFRKRCWNELLRIPYGETRTYAEIARAVGSPAGFRAVGQANHYNPVAIIVPCHRVLASGKRLGGYGGGLPVKALLLRLEGAEFREEATDTKQEPGVRVDRRFRRRVQSIHHRVHGGHDFHDLVNPLVSVSSVVSVVTCVCSLFQT